MGQWYLIKGTANNQVAYGFLPAMFVKNVKLTDGTPVEPDRRGDSVPVTPPDPVTIAYPSSMQIELDGAKMNFPMYALKDAKGNLTNYIKVRDLALALNGTKAQFAVEWDGTVNLVAGGAYTPNDSENSTPFSGEHPYTRPTSATKVNGKDSDLDAIFLTDANGGGYTYYQLRDLGRKLGFNVGWAQGRGAYIETDKPYSGAE